MKCSVRHIVFTVTFYLIHAGVIAQSGHRGLISGRVVDEDQVPIGGAYIKDLSSSDLAITDSSGLFRIAMEAGDSAIVVALGHEILKWKPDSEEFETIVLRKLSFNLRTVNVHGLKDWEQFKKDFVTTDVPGDRVNTDGLPSYKGSNVPVNLRSNLFVDKPSTLTLISSPFSAIAYAFSKSEKEKRRALALLRHDQAQKEFVSVVNRDSIQNLITIPDSLLDPFVIYCNLHIEDKTVGDTFYYKQRVIELHEEFLKKE